MSKVLKALWITTLFLVFSLLMYVFASLPEFVSYAENNQADRDYFFYIALGIIIIVNFPIYTVSRKFKSPTPLSQAMYGWLFALGVILNAFLFISLQFINLYNSEEQVQFTHYGIYLYTCLAFLIGNIITLPILFWKTRNK